MLRCRHNTLPPPLLCAPHPPLQPVVVRWDLAFAGTSALAVASAVYVGLLGYWHNENVRRDAEAERRKEAAVAEAREMADLRAADAAAVKAVEGLKEEMGRRFDEMGRRFDEMGRRQDIAVLVGVAALVGVAGLAVGVAVLLAKSSRP